MSFSRNPTDQYTSTPNTTASSRIPVRIHNVPRAFFIRTLLSDMTWRAWQDSNLRPPD